MQTINLQVNGKPLIFTGQSVSYEGEEYLYSKMSEITHRNGEFPAFIFTYDLAERISLPYDPKDKDVAMKIFQRVAALEKKRKEQSPETEEPVEPTAEPQDIETIIQTAAPLYKEKSFLKKKQFVIPVTIFLIILVLGCIWKFALNDGGTKQESYKGVTFEIPDKWVRSESDYGIYYYPDGENGFFSISVDGPSDFIASDTANEEKDSNIEYIKDSDTLSSDVTEDIIIVDGNNATKLTYSESIDDGKGDDPVEMNEVSIFIVHDEKLIELGFSTDTDNTNIDTFDKIIESIKL